jgi:hypothetical protein
VEKFLEENYATDEIVISTVGNFAFEEVRKMAERYFGDIPMKSRVRERIRPVAETSLKVTETRNTFQRHCMIVGEAFSLQDPRRLQLYLLNNILGGPGMNSRLNMALRERRGYSYSAESHYPPYTDTGALMIYFSSDPERFQKSLQVTREEIRKLRNKPIPEKRLRYSRKQLMGQLAISRENNEYLMLSTGKSYLIFNSVDTLEEIGRKLDGITPDQLRETANEWLHYVMLKSILLVLFFLYCSRGTRCNLPWQNSARPSLIPCRASQIPVFHLQLAVFLFHCMSTRTSAPGHVAMERKSGLGACTIERCLALFRQCMNEVHSSVDERDCRRACYVHTSSL